MVKQHSQLISLCLGVCDLAVISGAWLLAYEVRFGALPAKEVPEISLVVTNLVITLLVSLIVFAGTGLYKPKRDKSFLLELGQIIKGSLVIWAVLIVSLYFLQDNRFTRMMLVIFLPAMMAGLIFERGLFRSILRILRRRGWNLRHTLIVGTGRLAQSIYLKLQANTWTGIRVAGFVETNPADPRTEVRGVPVIGMAADLVKLVEDSGVDCVFVALASKQGDDLRQVIARLEETSVDVRIIPDLFLSRFPMNIAVSELDGLPILSLRENPLAGWPGIYKRIFDISGALFGLLTFGLFFMLPIALIIKLTSLGSGAGVLYKQRRVGFGGKPFFMYKFRTMRPDAEHGGPVFASKDDPRCTRIGAYLRSTSLDELPQLFNVLRGDMSLVGPRPERPEMMAKIREELPAFPRRLQVRAGLTGWAQINGYRGRTSFRKRLQYDLYYLNNWSPMLDLRIVLATVFRLRNPNAY